MPREPRYTADDYQFYVTSLCLAFRPGPDRADCVKVVTTRLLSIYAELDTPPPPGLQEFAESIGIGPDTELFDTNTELP